MNLIMLRARYRRIVFFFARILLGIIFWDLILPRLGGRETANRTRPERLRRAAASYRRLAVDMGGVMIKVGQFLSTRVDVLPPEFTDELQGLQDEVPPEDFDAIRRVAEAEYGLPLGKLFAQFERKPLAAASLGQVHRARLRQPSQLNPENAPGTGYVGGFRGVDVVVKIQRPDIELVIKTDLAALRTVGRWLQRYGPIRRRADVPALLNEFTRILYEEIDYLAEGRNAETFGVNFRGHPGVRVPRVVWSHTTRRALTLENVWSIKITDYEAIDAIGVSRSQVASRLLDTYLKQIFEDGFFHADPHPGNLFVNPIVPHEAASAGQIKNWELVFVDFGMVGRVPENLRLGLREMLIGVGTKDASRVVQSFQSMDLLLPNADLDLLGKAISREFDLFWGKTMSELTSVSFEEIQEFTQEFRDLLYEMPFQVPQNAIFLARCVGILSGICTGLDPDFNVWDHLAPYAQKLVAEEARDGLGTWLGEVEKFVRTTLVLPYRLDAALSKLERGEIAVRNPELRREFKRLEGSLSQVTGGLFFAAFLLGGIQLLLAGQPLFGGLLLGGAGIALVWTLIIRFAARN
jgi:predicted unusual protein kinase regulating ubiquinone biosynthesis (AarF/ABC1/UbiB family)